MLGAAFFKPPGGPPTPIHADQWHWPVSNENTITAWIPLQPVLLSNGPIVYFAGSCHIPSDRRAELCQSTEAAVEDYFSCAPYESQVDAYALGDMSFHRGWTFHGALANNSAKMRGVLTIVYMDAAIRLTNPRGSAPFSAITHHWCPGVRPGEVLASALNPLLFSQD